MTDKEPFSSEDISSIHALTLEYANTWLANDSERVMDLFSPDAVLIPHHGDPVIEGEAAIRAFWWPSGASALVTDFSTTIDEIGGYGLLGYVRGRFGLKFEYQAKRYTNAGNYLMLLRKDKNQSWKITHRMWDDPLPETEPI